MTLEDVADVVEMEGFDYAFRHYSSFEKVDDKEFHKLRQAYVDAADALENYLPEVEQ